MLFVTVVFDNSLFSIQELRLIIQRKRYTDIDLYSYKGYQMWNAEDRYN